MAVQKEVFGFFQGYKCWLFTLKNKSGAYVKVSNYGGVIQSVVVPDKNGNLLDVVQGYDTLEGYINGTSCQGAFIGRFANRIEHGTFTINGETHQLAVTDGHSCLHGGTVGFHNRVLLVEEVTDNSVLFSYISPDGEENFPGTVKATVRYTFSDTNTLEINYTATTDRSTVVNFTNHAYFNLNGQDSGSVLDHTLQLFTDKYTPMNQFCVPKGVIESVKGTPYDFTVEKLIGQHIRSGEISGYDNNFRYGDCGVMKKTAVLKGDRSGISMTVYTDKPDMQVYTANGLNETGKSNLPMKPQSSVCLETQFTPNAPNFPGVDSSVLHPGETYRFTTCYEFH